MAALPRRVARYSKAKRERHRLGRPPPQLREELGAVAELAAIFEQRRGEKRVGGRRLRDGAIATAASWWRPFARAELRQETLAPNAGGSFTASFANRPITCALERRRTSR